jgi:hypothetical protein
MKNPEKFIYYTEMNMKTTNNTHENTRKQEDEESDEGFVDNEIENSQKPYPNNNTQCHKMSFPYLKKNHYHSQIKNPRLLPALNPGLPHSVKNSHSSKIISTTTNNQFIPSHYKIDPNQVYNHPSQKQTHFPIQNNFIYSYDKKEILKQQVQIFQIIVRFLMGFIQFSDSTFKISDRAFIDDVTHCLLYVTTVASW